MATCADRNLYEEDEENTFKILIATDLHLGFKHEDPVRKHDAMGTFEEILQHGRDDDVDFVLLGGDLFHENKPPRDVMYDCQELLKRYCVGDRSQTFQVVSGEAADWDGDETPIRNISMPVFSIHGNHDEPIGPQNLSVMDLLHSSALVRYFGKTSSVREISVEPLLMRKGTSELAMCGVGFIRSNKLHKMFRKNRVTMDADLSKEGLFSLLVLHQNRVRRPDRSHVEESFIAEHLPVDLVVWGHEHESLIKPVCCQEGKFWLSQPGSSIATEFKKSEQAPKHVGILEVRDKEFCLKPIPLQTVRQIYIHEHVPRVLEGKSASDEAVVELLRQDCQRKVEGLLEEAERSRTGRQPEKPLIRIRVEQDQREVAFDIYKFGLKFEDRVANPDTIITFGRKKNTSDDGSSTGWSFPHNPHFAVFSLEELVSVELQKEKTMPLLVDKEDLLTAIKDFVNKNIKDAVDQFFREQLLDVQVVMQKGNALKTKGQFELTEAETEGVFVTDFSPIDEEVRKCRDERERKRSDQIVTTASSPRAARAGRAVEIEPREVRTLHDDDEGDDSWQDSETDDDDLGDDLFTLSPRPSRLSRSVSDPLRRRENTAGRIRTDSAADSPPPYFAADANKRAAPEASHTVAKAATLKRALTAPPLSASAGPRHLAVSARHPPTSVSEAQGMVDTSGADLLEPNNVRAEPCEHGIQDSSGTHKQPSSQGLALSADSPSTHVSAEPLLPHTPHKIGPRISETVFKDKKSARPFGSPNDPFSASWNKSCNQKLKMPSIVKPNDVSPSTSSQNVKIAGFGPSQAKRHKLDLSGVNSTDASTKLSANVWSSSGGSRTSSRCYKGLGSSSEVGVGVSESSNGDQLKTTVRRMLATPPGSHKRNNSSGGGGGGGGGSSSSSSNSSSIGDSSSSIKACLIDRDRNLSASLLHSPVQPVAASSGLYRPTGSSDSLKEESCENRRDSDDDDLLILETSDTGEDVWLNAS